VAALGAGFANVLVLENILDRSIERWRRWLLFGCVAAVTGEPLVRGARTSL
jgi:hypothetical protein